MNARNILVTGGAGYIGSHTCMALAAAGYVPVVLDNLSTGNREDVRWGPFEEGDVRDVDRVVGILEQHDIGAVMHFAASAYVGESVENPELYYGNNVVGIVHLLRACRQSGVSKVVFSSSCATYGIPEALPIHEGTPQIPINPYGRTKLLGEQVLQDYATAYSFNYAILRYFNACGADPSGELSEKHRPETHLIPLALMAACGRIAQLNVYGTDYSTPDGTCIRDYIHVTDLADGHVLALRNLEQGGSNLKVNLGSGIGHSIFEVIAAIKEVTGHEVPISLKPRRAGDPPVLLANPDLAKKILNFETRYSDIQTIVRHAAPTFGLDIENDPAC
ncbi:MAG: UDP-glucose 4-epimerase GalE [Rhodobacteraceae bacterium]|nr:UDP-glucose 4-epimerase GalE [Paracoccaceae bacterium]